jgi:hypothetical protein
MQDNKSEIARYMQQLALEEEAARRGLNGYAQVSQHDIIHATMNRGAERILHCIDTGNFDEATALMELPDWGGGQRRVVPESAASREQSVAR